MYKKDKVINVDIQAIIFNFPKTPDAGTRETLCTLRRRGYRLAANYEISVCDAFFPCRAEYKREDYLNTAKALGVLPGECAVVEGLCTSLNEIKNAGMTAIGMSEAMNCIYADTGISDISDLLDIFI